MDSARLQKLQERSRVERLLERLVTQAGLVPVHAYPVRDRGGLPLALQAVIDQASGQGRPWTCWTDSVRIWLFTAKLSSALSRERADPVLVVNAYGGQGDLEEVGYWMIDGEGNWQRCAD